MDVGLGMHILTRDDKDVGTVDRLILDPESGNVKAIVIRQGVFLPRDIEVPMDAMEVGLDGEVRLSYTADQVDQLPRFEESGYVQPPADYLHPAGYPASYLYWPAGYVPGPGFEPEAEPLLAPLTPPPLAPIVEDQTLGPIQAPDRAAIAEGSVVLSRDGKEVGTVHRLTYDPDSGALRFFVVRRGLLFKKDVDLPAALIEGAADGMIQLNVDADQLPVE